MNICAHALSNTPLSLVLAGEIRATKLLASPLLRSLPVSEYLCQTCRKMGMSHTIGRGINSMVASPLFCLHLVLSEKIQPPHKITLLLWGVRFFYMTSEHDTLLPLSTAPLIPSYKKTMFGIR